MIDEDGNCWMTQNLDYDIYPYGAGTHEVTLSAETSDVPSNFPKITVTGYDNATGVGEWSNQNDALKYYNPGLYVYTTPTEVNNCGSVANLSDCAAYGWKEYEPGDDEHYLVGNYYSWPAATAGTGNGLTTDGQQASGSVCPKNWKLPYGGTTYNNTSGSFYKMLNNYYGFVFDKTDSYGNVYGNLVSNTGQNIASAPLYFLRAGIVSGSSLMNYVGNNSEYWTSTVAAVDSSGGYYIAAAEVGVSHTHSGFLGLSVRCLIR